MEMWCPDDIGRDSWDWVGPPAWERACFNSPGWGGGSSPVKNGASPDCIVVVVVVVVSEWALSERISTALTRATQDGPDSQQHAKTWRRGLMHAPKGLSQLPSGPYLEHSLRRSDAPSQSWHQGDRNLNAPEP